MRTERAPRGVTRMAGANAYAAKLKISPKTTAESQLVAPTALLRLRRSLVTMPAHHVGFCMYV